MAPSLIQTLDSSLQSTLMEIWLNGLYTFLFLATMAGIYSRSQTGVGSKWIVSTVTLTMYLLSTVHMVMRWDLIRNVFIFHGDSRESQVGQLVKPGVWWIAITSSIFSANTLIADCLFIWRCWIIWGRNYRVILPSAVLTVIGTVFSVLADIAQITGIAGIESDLLSSALFTKSSTIYLALSFATTIIITILITYRIIKVDRETRAAFGDELELSSRRTYSSVIEVIIESAAIYSLAEMILMILLVRGSPTLRYAQNLVAQVTGLAPTLIVGRITFGMARNSSTWAGRSNPLPSLEFANDTATPESRTTIGGDKNNSSSSVGGETPTLYQGTSTARS